MQKEINLLDLTEKVSLEESKTHRKRMETSIGIFIVFILIAGAIFGYYYYLARQLSQIILLSNAKESEVETLKPIEEKYLVVKDKTSAIAGIIVKRPNLVPMLDLLQNTTPEGISYETVGIPSDDKISVSGTAQNSAVLISYFNTISTDVNFTKYLKEVSVNSVNLEKEGVYKFDLLFTLNPGGNK